MKNKILLLVGTGIGYVLGARAGREKYDSLVEQAQGLWGDPRVQDAVSTAKSSTGSAFSQAQDQVKGKVTEVKESRSNDTGNSSFSQTTNTGTRTTTGTATPGASSTGGSTSGFQPTTNTSSFGTN
ncbi:YtxH domain-containing protein [Kytococcus sp. Marseille-QA3725]